MSVLMDIVGIAAIVVGLGILGLRYWIRGELKAKGVKTASVSLALASLVLAIFGAVLLFATPGTVLTIALLVVVTFWGATLIMVTRADQARRRSVDGIGSAFSSLGTLGAMVVAASLLSATASVTAQTVQIDSPYQGEVKQAAVVIGTIDGTQPAPRVTQGEVTYYAYDAPAGSNNFGPTPNIDPGDVNAVNADFRTTVTTDPGIAASWVMTRRAGLNADKDVIKKLALVYKDDRALWQRDLDFFFAGNCGTVLVDTGKIPYYSFGMIPGVNRSEQPTPTQQAALQDMGIALFFQKCGGKDQKAELHEVGDRVLCKHQPSAARPFENVAPPAGQKLAPQPTKPEGQGGPPPSSSTPSTSTTTSPPSSTTTTTSPPSSTTTTTSPGKEPTKDPCAEGKRNDKDGKPCPSPTISAPSTTDPPAASTHTMPSSVATTLPPPAVTTVPRTQEPGPVEGPSSNAPATGTPEAEDGCDICGAEEGDDTGTGSGDGADTGSDTTHVQPETTTASEPAVTTTVVPTAFSGGTAHQGALLLGMLLLGAIVLSSVRGLSRQ